MKTLLGSTLTCPQCGFQKTETMPTDACLHLYPCAECGALLKPRAGDCCVFCSYGSVKCPLRQAEEDGCAWGGLSEGIKKK